MHGVAFKKRAPRAVKAIKEFAIKAMVCALPCNHLCITFYGAGERSRADVLGGD